MYKYVFLVFPSVVFSISILRIWLFWSLVSSNLTRIFSLTPIIKYIKELQIKVEYHDSALEDMDQG